MFQTKQKNQKKLFKTKQNKTKQYQNKKNKEFFLKKIKTNQF